MKNVLIVNFKTYEEATGSDAIKLAKICEKVAKEMKKDIRIAVQETDLCCIAKTVNIPVYSQHIDPVEFGANTGFIVPESVKKVGAKGTLLNHSEHHIKDIEKSISAAKRAKLVTVVCADSVKKGIDLAKYKPDFIAVEPPELIGGEISVSTAEPEIIKNAVKKIRCNVLVGAGIRTAQDVKIAIELGAKGILLASGVVKAKNPAKVLKELAKEL
jgi:triosephosphate isomerase